MTNKFDKQICQKGPEKRKKYITSLLLTNFDGKTGRELC